LPEADFEDCDAREALFLKIRGKGGKNNIFSLFLSLSSISSTHVPRPSVQEVHKPLRNLEAHLYSPALLPALRKEKNLRGIETRRRGEGGSASDGSIRGIRQVGVRRAFLLGITDRFIGAPKASAFSPVPGANTSV